MRKARPYMANRPKADPTTKANVEEAPTTGRPTTFTEELANVICERLINGQSLRMICRDPVTPGRPTVLRWLAQHQPFQRQYALAREMQADAVADEILEIADDRTGDFV